MGKTYRKGFGKKQSPQKTKHEIFSHLEEGGEMQRLLGKYPMRQLPLQNGDYKRRFYKRDRNKNFLLEE